MRYAIVIALFLLLPIAKSQTVSHNQLTDEQEQFVTNLVKKDHFNRRKITQYLLKSQPAPSVITKIKHPAEKRGWQRYKHIFIRPAFIGEGYTFYKKNEKILKAAYKRYGVDPAIIVALMGVETRYGTVTGRYSAIRALNTLAFFHSHHPHFFQRELRALFLLARKLQIDPESIHSSYAGALGMPQFMPSTYLAYGKSQSNHEMADLFHTPGDAIFSIANYLKRLGWKKNAGTAEQVSHPNQKHTENIILGEGASAEYWKPLPNLKYIKCYNHSTQYAIVVTLLAKKIRTHHG